VEQHKLALAEPQSWPQSHRKAGRRPRTGPAHSSPEERVIQTGASIYLRAGSFQPKTCAAAAFGQAIDVTAPLKWGCVVRLYGKHQGRGALVEGRSGFADQNLNVVRCGDGLIPSVGAYKAGAPCRIKKWGARVGEGDPRPRPTGSYVEGRE
jgi:hypothetical protein